ncbi:helix-turn-helix domain-containing protein [Massilia sp. CFBP9012]|uniref:winged helix-turn-helix transcriptional regulator n=1 Tax=Massilia sp. CFBP9012 TaxID=3096531 RepID=UPI002A69A5ED|nr:helix-turn-helix domain-containing protein [Massilia sp. CFBP9012]MDY0974044.1 helix-turn-helix domain-containing protein [Massilia sp. CFBP9012]
MKEAAFNCGMEAVLDLIAGKWKLMIVYHLMHGGQLRFSELRRLVGNVSEKMLSQQLKEMACDGLVQRIDFRTVPPHVEYALTGFGKSLASTLQPLCAWGSENMEEIGAISSARAIRSA